MSRADIAATTPGALIAAVRGASADSVLVRIDDGGAPTDQAQLVALIEPLAIEAAAAGRRVNALLVAEGAAPADVAAAGDWLAAAPSTTGQLVRISPRE